jgi:hypothetical protein
MADFSVFNIYNIVRPDIHDDATSSDHRRQIEGNFVTDVPQLNCTSTAICTTYNC